MDRPVIIYGIGALARVTYQTLRGAAECRVLAFTADQKFVADEQFTDLPLVGFEKVEERYPPADHDMLVLVGYKRMRDRKVMFDRAKEKGYRLRNIIGRTTTLPEDLDIGENNLIGDFVYLGPFSRIGNNNIIRPNTHIGHNAKIGDHTFISPGCSIAGTCEVQDLSYVGIGATVSDCVTIGEESLVGAGAVVLRDTEPCSQYLGNPAQKVGEHQATGILLLR